MKRTTDDILAEAKADEQDTPVKDPFVLVLKSGHEVSFKDPRDIPIEVADTIGGSFKAQLDAMLNSQDQRRFWREWGKVPQRYVGGLVSAIIDHYTGDEDTEGKERSSAS
jgi:hypothetical protein